MQKYTKSIQQIYRIIQSVFIFYLHKTNKYLEIGEMAIEWHAAIFAFRLPSRIVSHNTHGDCLFVVHALVASIVLSGLRNERPATSACTCIRVFIHCILNFVLKAIQVHALVQRI